MDNKALIEQNRAYNRERQRMDDLDFKHKDIDKFIKDNHKQALKEIQTKIDSFYISYANEKGVSLKDVKKRASKMDVTKFQDKAREEVKKARELADKLGRNVTYADFSNSTNEWLRLYNLKMKVSRLELMKADISLDLHSMYLNDTEYIAEVLNDEAINELRYQAGILGNSAELSKDRIDNLIMADFHGKNFSQRVWGHNGHYHETQKEVFKSLTSIYTDMNGYKSEMKRLSDRFDVKEGQALTLLKTEMARVRSQAAQVGYEENGFTHYRYVSERGACNICGDLDGKIFKVSEREKGVNSYPMHPNCKCRDYGIIELIKNGKSNIK